MRYAACGPPEQLPRPEHCLEVRGLRNVVRIVITRIEHLRNTSCNTMARLEEEKARNKQSQTYKLLGCRQHDLRGIYTSHRRRSSLAAWRPMATSVPDFTSRHSPLWDGNGVVTQESTHSEIGSVLIAAYFSSANAQMPPTKAFLLAQHQMQYAAVR
jgi:hypothetical protein